MEIFGPNWDEAFSFLLFAVVVLILIVGNLPRRSSDG
jgi:hypothetical protein